MSATMEDINLIVIRETQGCMMKWETNKPLSKEEAVQVQQKKGYPVAGYGFFEYKVTDQKTTWTSYSAC